MKRSNNSGGATQPKSGDAYTPLCRGKGFSETMSAMESKTRSGHPATSKHNQWESAGGSETGGNVHGWSPE